LRDLMLKKKTRRLHFQRARVSDNHQDVEGDDRQRELSPFEEGDRPE